jgi:hypothetical protein
MDKVTGFMGIDRQDRKYAALGGFNFRYETHVGVKRSA